MAKKVFQRPEIKVLQTAMSPLLIEAGSGPAAANQTGTFGAGARGDFNSAAPWE